MMRSVANTVIQIEDDRTGMDIQVLRRAFLDNLMSLQGKSRHTATPHDLFFALAYTVRDRLYARWIKTTETYYEVDAKRVYYLSAEFLVGRSLTNNLINLGVYDRAKSALESLGFKIEDILEQEPDAGLGNGGLGRLAACFLDSMATLGLAGYGYGLRYEFGIFNQVIRAGAQVERPDEWLRAGNPWEIARPEFAFEIKLGGRTEMISDGHGGFRVSWVDTRSVIGVPYDTPIPGMSNDTVNTMRLWRARASEEFDLAVFNAGDYVRAVEEKNLSENISKVLYPVDHSPQGKELRLKQQYFFVACSVQDIVRRYLLTHRSFESFPDKVAIQLNDTHPSIAIPELMRILVDEHRLPWDQAWDITVRSCAYTNHTILAEALEKWPVALFHELLPRHLEIIYEINAHFLREVRNRHPRDLARLERMSIIQEQPLKQVRMAHLAIVGSHAVNGVAALHTQLLRESLFPDFADLWPERFQNKTNGVTPRRWLLAANPRLATAITDRIGPAWITDLGALRALEPFADDPDFRAQVATIKELNKRELAHLIERETGLRVDPTSLFSVQVKRFHEYKRQLLNVLHVIALYRRIKEGQDPGIARTVILAGKAAPGYTMAKLHIRLIHAVMDVVNNDREVAPRLRVAFIPNYRVSTAEAIMPAADLSEQISTAGYEASGTGNMKLALNGALTIGTLDGANVEIREEVGAENFFLFGLDAAEVMARRRQGYHPVDELGKDAELAMVLELLGGGFFTPEEPRLFQPIVDSLLGEDRFLVLADFRAYMTCQEQVAAAWRDPDRWQRMAILNIARMGKFSSDRTIKDYAHEIWGAQPVKVVLAPYTPP
jgi:starch phosphorylase